MGMREPGERQPEVVEAMLQHHAGNHDAEHVRVGEVGQAETAGRVLLPEHNILLRPSQRPPRSYPSLQRAPNAGVDLWMTPPDLGQHGDRPQTRRRLQDRHDLGIPDLGSMDRAAAGHAAPSFA